MYKKSILSVAIASSLMLTGCFDNNKLDDENAGALTTPPVTATSGSAYPEFSPAVSKLPIPNDLLFDKVAGDGTFLVPDSSPPVTTALNQLSGASTVAPIDIKILSGEVDEETLIDKVTLIPNVYLLELKYASGSPLQGLSIGEPPTFAGFADVALEHIVLDGDSYIRINPKTPLKPNTRYEVVITNGVKDTLDQPLVKNPGVASYAALSDPNIPLANPALAPVRQLINSLWEPLAMKVLNLADDSSIVLTYTLTTSGDEKVMEYIANPSEWFNDQLTTFIGVSTAKSIITNKTDLNADGAVDYSDIYLAINATSGVEEFDGAMASFPSAAIQGALSRLFGVGRPCNGLTSSIAITCISNSLAGAPTSLGGFSNLLPTPTPQSATTASKDVPISLVSAPVASLIDDPTKPPLVSQGTINIPYYLGIPAGTDAEAGKVINDKSWTADTELATAINSAFYSIGLSLPQGRTTDPEAGFSPTNPPTLADFTVAAKSSVVNYIYPFPKQSDAVIVDEDDVTADNKTIPWLAIYPHPSILTANGGTVTPKGTVIYQHGITTDRSAALSAGTILADQGFTVIAIDQVAHGTRPASTESKLGLAATLLTAGQEGGLPPSLAANETNNQAIVDGMLNIGFVSTAATGGDTDAAATLINQVLTGAGSAGPLDPVIKQLASFENTVENAGSTIPGIGFTANERHFDFTADAGLNPTPMNLNPASTAEEGASGSLFINLLGFTNSRDKNRQGVIDLLNLRESLGNIDLNGDGTLGDLNATNVFFIGHSLGTVSGIPFVTVANSTSVGNIAAASFWEPASGISRMLENSGSFSPRILGGLALATSNTVVQGTSSFETYMNTLQATLDSVDPINFADNMGGSATDSFQTNADLEGSLLLINVGTADGNGTTVFKSDQTNIIEAETIQLGNAKKSYFAGVEKFADALVVKDVIGATPDGTADKLRSRLAFGNHGMFVLPIVSAAETAELGATEAAAEANRRGAAFLEGITQTITFFSANGEMTTDGLTAGITDKSGLTAIPSILINETDYDARPKKQLN